jgi:hypothetical protein
MHLTLKKRSWFSYGVLLTLATQLVSAGLPLKAQAATEHLVINEINWAGSASQSNDEWIEIYNAAPMGSPALDFAQNPYVLEIKDAADASLQTFELKNGALQPGNYVLLRGMADASQSTVNDALPSGAWWYPDGHLDMLPNEATQYILKEKSTGIEADAVKAATPASAIPFAGSATAPIASMERVYTAGVAGVGTAQASWHTSATHGAGFRAGVDQYGTPGAANPSFNEVAVPHHVAISPELHSTLPTLPTITGEVASNAVTVRLYAHQEGVIPSTTKTFDAAVVSNSFSVMPSGLEAGRYTFQIDAADVLGNRSDRVNVAVAANSSEYNYLIFADASSPIAVPTVDALPAITNQPTVVAHGTVNTADNVKAVDIVRNGEYLQTAPVSDNAFTATMFLLANQENSFRFIAVTAENHVSAPSTAQSVVHDNMAPLAVVASKVKVDANQPGTPDYMSGLVGAAEANTKLSVYSDAALTQMVVPSMTVATDGSFAQVNLGDNRLAKVYLRLMDAAGNMSPLTVIENPIAFANPTNGIGLVLASVSQTQARFTWQPVGGAVNYKVKYKTANGEYTSAMLLCPAGTTSCATQATLINLTAGSSYVVAVASVDAYGNETAYSELAFQTSQPTPVVTTAEVKSTTTTTKSTTTTTPTRRVQPSPTPVPAEIAPVATPTPSPETGEVKSTTDEAARNVTPWIVLGILLAIAVLATLGYFYWFGGVEGAEAGAASAAAAKKRSDEQKVADSSKPEPKKPNNKDKRW